MWEEYDTYYEHLAKQGTEEWKNARYGLITSSTIGYLAGHGMKFKTPEEIGKIIAGIKQENNSNEKEEDNSNINEKRMEHGKKFEPIARKWYEKKIGKEIIERGLCISKFQTEFETDSSNCDGIKLDNLLGASVDGDILNTDKIIEIKCPQEMYNSLILYDLARNSGHIFPKNYHDHIIQVHYDQMQTCMKVLNKKICVYIVYSTSDKKCFVQEIPFNEEYFNNLYEKAKENYKLYVEPYLNISF